MSPTKTRNTGFMLVEILVAITITGILLAGMGVSLYEFRNANRYQLLKQRCINAGQAQLDAVAVGGEVISAGEIERLWPGIKVTLSERAGADQWQGLKFIEVTATAVFNEKTIEVKLSRYLGPQAEK